MPSATDLQFREARFPTGFVCPHCQATSVIRYGHERSGLQRYTCKACHRTFNDRTSTPMARTHKPAKWANFALCMREAYSCRKAAVEIGVNHKTVFAWRHKVLASITTIPKPLLTGIVEADEMTFRRSFKGSTPVGRPSRKRGGRRRSKRPRGQGEDKVFVMVARNRDTRTASFVMETVTKDALIAQVGPSLAPTVLCTDGSQALAAFARECRLEHIAIPASDGRPKRGIYHIQNINAYHARFDHWMDRFHGVATKYLHHYANWHIAVEQVAHRPVREITRMLFASATLSPATPRVQSCPYCGTILPSGPDAPPLPMLLTGPTAGVA